jgi:hypothetical protein
MTQEIQRVGKILLLRSLFHLQLDAGDAHSVDLFKKRLSIHLSMRQPPWIACLLRRVASWLFLTTHIVKGGHVCFRNAISAAPRSSEGSRPKGLRFGPEKMDIPGDQDHESTISNVTHGNPPLRFEVDDKTPASRRENLFHLFLQHLPHGIPRKGIKDTDVLGALPAV